MRAIQPVERPTKLLNVIIETPKGSRNKFKLDEELGRFKLSKVLPAGTVFPFDFGFLPETRAQDGDPIDVLVLMDAQTFPGCLVRARLIGVIEAEQGKKKTAVRNDRLIAVAKEATDYSNLQTHRDLNDQLLKEYEHFFVSYHALTGKEYRILDVRGPKRAMRLVIQAQ